MDRSRESPLNPTKHGSPVVSTRVLQHIPLKSGHSANVREDRKPA
jgi:hypothetical protein